MDREKVIKTLTDALTAKENYPWAKAEMSFEFIEMLLALLKEQEAVVRCKDCVFGKREKNDSTGMTWIYCGHHRENRQEDWFCASGSRI